MCVVPFADKSHVDFFGTQLAELYSASKKGYSVLQTKCKAVLSVINRLYPELPEFVDRGIIVCHGQDTYSKSLMPPELSNTLVPIKCGGDGNCLFRYSIMKSAL